MDAPVALDAELLDDRAADSLASDSVDGLEGCFLTSRCDLLSPSSASGSSSGKPSVFLSVFRGYKRVMEGLNGCASLGDSVESERQPSWIEHEWRGRTSRADECQAGEGRGLVQAVNVLSGPRAGWQTGQRAAIARCELEIVAGS